MATVRFYAKDSGFLPDVCMKTGHPTTDRVQVDAYFRPSWPLLLLPFNWLVSAVGVVAGTRRYPVEVPVDGAVATRYRLIRTAAGAVIVSGVAIMFIAAAFGVMSVSLAFGVVVGGLIAWWANLRAHTCSLEVSSDGQVVTIRRCSRRFKAAMRELDRAD